eukprot:PhM_4_TR293/c0_g1_i1/m.27815/K10730/RECQL4; ATP-dependent DNA helicase Q4
MFGCGDDEADLFEEVVDNGNRSDGDVSQAVEDDPEDDVPLYLRFSHNNSSFRPKKKRSRVEKKPTPSVRHSMINADSTPEEVLHSVFGFAQFRTGQCDVIGAIVGGESVAAVLPTGHGKSLCYQIPIMMMRARRDSGKLFCLVVSPLVSLMQDQVRSLPPQLPGVALCSGSGSYTNVERLFSTKIALEGSVGVVFCSPERLTSDGPLAQALAQYGKEFCAYTCIDEAHCISEWGHDFRPAYSILTTTLRSLLGAAHPILAVTATATKGVTSDLMRAIKAKRLVRKDYPRDHLLLKARHVATSSAGGGIDELRAVTMRGSFSFQQQLDALSSVLFDVPSKSIPPTIVYTSTQRHAEEVATYLQNQCRERFCENPAVDNGTFVRAYHAGMDRGDRRDVQNAFVYNHVPIVVATIAFGMGIDKPDVRRVVHFSMPGSLEQYVQETGRAGRDRNQSECTVLLDHFTFFDHRRRSHASAVTLQNMQALCQHLLRPNDFRNPHTVHSYALDTREIAMFLDVEEQHVLGLCFLVQSLTPNVLRVAPQRHRFASISAHNAAGGAKKKLSASSSLAQQKQQQHQSATETSILKQLAVRDPVVEFLMPYLASAKAAFSSVSKGNGSAAVRIDVFSSAYELGNGGGEASATSGALGDHPLNNFAIRLNELSTKDKMFDIHWSHSVHVAEVRRKVSEAELNMIARTAYARHTDLIRRNVERVEATYSALLTLAEGAGSESATLDSSSWLQNHLVAYMEGSTAPAPETMERNELFFVATKMTLSETDKTLIRGLLTRSHELNLSPLAAAKVLWGIPTQALNGLNAHVRGQWGRLLHIPMPTLMEAIAEEKAAMRSETWTVRFQ